MLRKRKYEISSNLGEDSELGNEKEHIGGYGGGRHVSGTFVGRSSISSSLHFPSGKVQTIMPYDQAVQVWKTTGNVPPGYFVTRSRHGGKRLARESYK